jgi:hypothetical protein
MTNGAEEVLMPYERGMSGENIEKYRFLQRFLSEKLIYKNGGILAFFCVFELNNALLN